jgi:formate dehydrogenase major subunit
MRPLRVDGRLIHQVAMPWHWGFSGTNTGDTTNDLGAFASDPNVSIQESKAFSCDVHAGRREGQATERLAGKDLGVRVRTDEDDPVAEDPKAAGDT